MAWAVTLYSKGDVTRAGKMLIDTDATQEQRMQALDVMSSWRAAHAYPMHALLMMLRRKVAEIDKKAVVVQRHKRAPSIIDKLTRFPQMELSRMQDIGGCRAIVSSVRDVELLNERIQKAAPDTNSIESTTTSRGLKTPATVGFTLLTSTTVKSPSTKTSLLSCSYGQRSNMLGPRRWRSWIPSPSKL